MLEERSFLVSRSFNSNRDNTWGFMSNCRIEKIESHQEKRPLDIEDEEIIHPTKSRKQSPSYDNLDLGLGFLDLSSVPIDQSDNNQGHAGDDANLDLSLVPIDQSDNNQRHAGDDSNLDLSSVPIDQSDNNQCHVGDDSDLDLSLAPIDQSDNNQPHAGDDSDLDLSLVPIDQSDNNQGHAGDDSDLDLSSVPIDQSDNNQRHAGDDSDLDLSSVPIDQLDNYQRHAGDDSNLDLSSVPIDQSDNNQCHVGDDSDLDLSLAPIDQSDNYQPHAGDDSDLDLSLVPIDQSDNNQGHAGDDSDLDLSSVPIDQSDNNQRHAGDDSDLDLSSVPIDQFDNYQRHAGDDSNLDFSLVPIDQSDNNQRHAGDDSDPSSLIHAIGRDNSISCLLKCSRFDYGSLASVNRTFRDLIRSGELYRLRRKHGIIEHWVYFSCHLVQWEAFDPIKRRWMNLPTMSSNTCFQFSDKESLAVGTELLVLGKEVLDHVIYKYSLLTNSWSAGRLMNEPRCLFGSASLGEIAIVAGGTYPNGKIVNSAELYNSESGAWETLPNMLKPRKMCSGVFMDKKFYVIGGIGGTDMKPLTCGEEYDLGTRVWKEIPNMSPVRADGAANATSATEAPPLVAVVDNELYAADCADMEVRKYDKERKEWETVGRLPERADSTNGWGIAFRGCGDRVIVIGGPRTSGAGFIEVNSWVPRDGPPRWTMLERKQSSYFVYNCAVMGC